MFAVITDACETPPLSPPSDSGSCLVSETPSLRVAVRTFGGLQILQDEARGVDVVIHGQIHDGMTLPRLVSAYLDDGPGFVKGCSGSFALLLVDRGADAIFVATDRLGSRPLHLREESGRTCVSTSLAHLVTPTSTLDRAGVAWYLSCGVVHTDRTVLEAVSRVPCASWVAFAHGRRDVTQYWRYELTGEYAGKPVGPLRDELADLLISSVKKRLGDGEAPLLSLSAGHDSRGILAVLTRVLHMGDVETFSYGMTEDLPDSDVAIARRLAAKCGLPHQFQLSYDGSLADVVERNALWGDGSANFCDEALAWDRLVAQHQAQRPPLFLGDTAFNSSKAEVLTPQDVIDDTAMRSFAGLSWLERLLPRGEYGALRDAQAADLERFERMITEMDEVLDMQDFLYVDEYLPRRLLQWRECFAGRGFAIQQPLLDNDLLDFTARLPADLRRQKRLYVEAATALAPDLFAVPRAAVSGGSIDWRSELQGQAGSFTVSRVRDQSPSASLLDDVIDPGVVDAILRLPQLSADEKPLQQATRRVMRKQWRRVRRKISGRPLPMRVSAVEFLRRYLVLRRFLEVSGPDSLLTSLSAAGQDGAPASATMRTVAQRPPRAAPSLSKARDSG